MKKITTFLVVCAALLATNCSSEDDGPTRPPGDASVTFNGTVKIIMQDYCLSCHGDPPVNGAPISLVTATEVKSAIENSALVTRIENGTMPPGNRPKLTDDEIQLVKDWQAGGFKE